MIRCFPIARPRPAVRPPRGLVPGLVLILGSIAGCHVGDFSASIDSNFRLPQIEFSAIPSQSEPPVESADGIESDGGGASKAE